MTEITLKTILKAIDDKQGEDIEIIDVRNISPFATYYVICTANNKRRVHAIQEAVQEELEKMGQSIHHCEGNKDSEWVLVDAYDVIVHIFSPEERKRFDFRSLFQNEPHLDPDKLLQ